GELEVHFITHAHGRSLCLPTRKEASDTKVSRPREGPLSPNFDPSKNCENHCRVEGHTLEECYHLKDRVQDLIDNKLTQFDNAATSNIITNPLPPHQEGNKCKSSHDKTSLGYTSEGSLSSKPKKEVRFVSAKNVEKLKEVKPKIEIPIFANRTIGVKGDLK
ncbi:hypothetical protein SO802_020417, partial [Lithocarpus litseifolius]